MLEVSIMTCIFLEKNKLLTPKATETQAKNAFKGLFEKNAEEVFGKMNVELRESLLGKGNAYRFDLFEKSILNTKSELYKFVIL